MLAAANQVFGQYAPPPPPASFSGFINEPLREANEYWNKWDFGGSARFRYEIKKGFAIQGVGAGPTSSLDFRANGQDVDNEYLLTRIRFHAGYTADWWNAYVEGQSSLAASDERYAYPNVPAVPGTVRKQGDGPESDVLDVHQAYVTLGNLKQFPVTLKVGRQELSYGEERLVGAFGWNNIGRTFDAAKLRWHNGWFDADLFASRPVIPEDGRFDVSNDYDWFSGLYITSAKIPKTLLDLYFFSRNASQQAIAAEPSPQFPQPSARDIYTVGGRLKSKTGDLGNFDYLLDGAYQFGNFRDRRLGADSKRLDQDAFMFISQAGYTFVDAFGSPRLGLEYDFSSGDSNVNDGKHQTFDSLFPTSHKFNGYMNFFSLQNIHDLRSIFQLTPIPRVSLAIEGHAFWLADTHDSFYSVTGAPRGGATLASNVGTGTGYGINPTYGSFVGTELDAIAGVAVTRFAQLEIGYGHFFTGDYIDQSLSAPGFGSRDADYVYIQANINF